MTGLKKKKKAKDLLVDKKWTREFAARVEAALGAPERPYRRPGADPGLALTDEWWRLYDEAVASRQRQMRRWGDPAALVGGRAPGGFGGVGVPRGRFIA